MEEIYFSILVPVYNVDKHLEYCLNSVRNQTYENYEVILIDDGSTDKSGEICDKFCKVDKRFKVYHKKNEGLARARYEGMKRIKGSYTLFLDSDDAFDSNLLDTVKKNIEKYNGDIIIFNYKHMDEQSELLFNGQDNFQGTKIFEFDKKLIYDKIFFTDEINSIWRKAVKSSLIKIEDYENYLSIENGEDNMFSIPLLIKSKKIISINDKLYKYRYNFNGITSIFKESKIKDEIIRYNYTLNYLKELRMYDGENRIKLNVFFLKKILRNILKFEGLTNKSYKEKQKKLKKLRKSKELINMFEETNIRKFNNSSKKIYKYYKNEKYILIYIFSKIYILPKKVRKYLKNRRL